MPAISGIVRDTAGQPAKRLVRLHRRDSGELIDQVFSDASTGAYSITTSYTGEHYAILHDVQAADPYWHKVVLAMHMDNGASPSAMVDLKGGAVSSYYGTFSTSTLTKKFGSASLRFNNSDYQFKVTNAALDGFSGDFTVEMWVNPASAGAFSIFTYGSGGPTAAAGRFGLYSSYGYLTFGTYNGSTSAVSNMFTTGAWHHIAIVRSGTQVKVYVNGTSYITRTDTTSFNSTVVGLGTSFGLIEDVLNGYIDDVRITKGVARYTEDFTPPVAAFEDNSALGGTENAQILDRLVPV